MNPHGVSWNDDHVHCDGDLCTEQHTEIWENSETLV